MAEGPLEEEFALETPIPEIFVAPSIQCEALLGGESYTYFSDVPPSLQNNSASSESSADSIPGPECVIGVDEAGRGPVLGPMVYGLFYLPKSLSEPLLRTKYQFDDSKVLKPNVRSHLMQEICTPGTDLATQCGWATEVMSARDISANMMKPAATYNLNAQAMDATISLIHGVYQRGINVKEIYIDTIGKPDVYQKKLEKIFPTALITVAKKADSLYPCVSAASVCAKVTRDAALHMLYQNMSELIDGRAATTDDADESWGSGYPSDAKCTSWLKRNMHPIFGWGSECRFSWGTAKDLLELGGLAAKVDWPVEEDHETSQLTKYFNAEKNNDMDEFSSWFGRPVGPNIL